MKVNTNTIYWYLLVDRNSASKAYPRRSFVIKAPIASSSEMIIQFTLWSVFQDEVYFLVIIEIPVKTKYIGMAKVGLDFDFTSQLMLNLVVNQLSFE